VVDLLPLSEPATVMLVK